MYTTYTGKHRGLFFYTGKTKRWRSSRKRRLSSCLAGPPRKAQLAKQGRAEAHTWGGARMTQVEVRMTLVEACRSVVE